MSVTKSLVTRLILLTNVLSISAISDAKSDVINEALPATVLILDAFPATLDTLELIPATVLTFACIPATVDTFEEIPATVVMLPDYVATVPVSATLPPISAFPVEELKAKYLPLRDTLEGNVIEFNVSLVGIFNALALSVSICCKIA